MSEDAIKLFRTLDVYFPSYFPDRVFAQALDTHLFASDVSDFFIQHP